MRSWIIILLLDQVANIECLGKEAVLTDIRLLNLVTLKLESCDNPLNLLYNSPAWNALKSFFSAYTGSERKSSFSCVATMRSF